MMAVWRRGRPQELLHHSDQGSQYTSGTYLNYINTPLADLSMRGVGNCYDNAVIESYFSTLKTECVTGVFLTHAQARAVIFEYMGGFGTIANAYALLWAIAARLITNLVSPFNRVH
jgi:putative transposase